MQVGGDARAPEAGRRPERREPHEGRLGAGLGRAAPRLARAPGEGPNPGGPEGHTEPAKLQRETRTALRRKAR